MSATVTRADESCRLPRNIVPSKYDIALVPDMSNWTFEGHLIITLQCHQPTETIVLHAADLTFPNDNNGHPRITLTSLDDTTANTTVASSVRLSSEDQTVTIVLPTALSAGSSYHLSIHYRGTLNESLAGFYRSSYTRPPLLSASTLSTVAPSTVPLAVTQFEATDARRALPCIDEPAVKAVFAVTIIAPPNVTAVSNMPVLAKITVPANSARGLQHPAGHIMYMYADTPKMSTYLLAFFIGEFDYISSIAANKVEIRVYTPIGKASSGYFALNVATKCLLYYESLFNSPYPLPKMDLLAIPDFAAGAMENVRNHLSVDADSALRYIMTDLFMSCLRHVLVGRY